MFDLRKLRYGLLLYAAFDLFFGGICGGFLPLTPLAAAQFTTVSGTVTDPNGLPYANGTITATLVISGSPTLNGLAYTPPAQPVGLNSAGSFVMQLADNTVLLPSGSQWKFSVSCAVGCIPLAGGKGPVSFNAGPITISGASQSITATLTAAALALSAITGGSTLTINPTNNVLPRRSSATSFADSALTDNGTTVTSSEGFLLPQGTGNGYSFTGVSTATFAYDQTTWSSPAILQGPGRQMVFQNGAIDIPSGSMFRFCVSIDSSNSGCDTAASRDSADVWDFGSTVADTTARLKASAYLVAGTKFTTNGGCGETSATTVGGATAGQFTTSGSTSCTTVITFGNTPAPPNSHWHCSAEDRTTGADFANPHITTDSATTVTLVSGTIVAGDVISFGCTGY